MKYAVNIWRTGLNVSDKAPDPERWFQPVNEPQPEGVTLYALLYALKAEGTELWLQLVPDEESRFIGVGTSGSGIPMAPLFPKYSAGNSAETFIRVVKELGGKTYFRLFHRLTGVARMMPCENGASTFEKSEEEMFLGVFGILPASVKSQAVEGKQGGQGWRAGW